jgi:DNA-binding CsgD family transcriptional regulator
VVVDVALASVLAYYLDEDWPERVERALALAAGAGVGRWGAFGLYFPAFAAVGLARLGQGEAAEGLLRQLTPLLENNPPQVTHLPMSVHAAGAAVWELGLADFAPAYERMALRVLDAGVGDSQIGSSALTAACMLALQGRHDAAERYFQLGCQHAEANGQQGVLAAAGFQQAQALLLRGPAQAPPAAALLEQSAANFDQLGMPGWKARAEKALCAARDGRLPPQTNAQPSGTLAHPAAPAGSGTHPGGAQHKAGRAGKLPGGLTAREAQVLGLIAGGRTNQEIASELVVSVATVERHISNLYRKINARGRADATAYALSHGLAEVG